MDNNEQNQSADYTGFSLVSGGLIYNIMMLVFSSSDPKKSRKSRAIFFSLVAWLPLGILILFTDNGASIITNELNFLKDFPIHIRFLFAVPFFILIESMVNNSFTAYIKTSDNLISIKEQSRFDKLVSTINKLSNLYAPEVIMLIIIYAVIIIKWNDSSLLLSSADYMTNSDGGFSIVGMYYLFISIPLFQLLLFRWFWRWVIWVYSILKISGFTFSFDALNIDEVAGLTYLNFTPLLFSFIFFAMGAVIAGDMGYDIIYNGASLKSFYIDILFFIIIVPVILYSPLLIFIPSLLKAKSNAVYKMGSLVNMHNQEYMNKWVNKTPFDKEVLGAVDNSSLSDINGGYASAINMKVVPVNFKMFVTSCFILIIPFIPLIFTYYSIFDLFKMVLDSTLG